MILIINNYYLIWSEWDLNFRNTWFFIFMQIWFNMNINSNILIIFYNVYLCILELFPQLTSIENINTFKNILKTYFFEIYYNVIHLFSFPFIFCLMLWYIFKKYCIPFWKFMVLKYINCNIAISCYFTIMRFELCVKALYK